jgi:hypothetical protein
MEKKTLNIFLHHSNSEGKRLANVLGKRVTDEANDDADAPFVPDKFIKLCFLRILVESRKELYEILSSLGLRWKWKCGVHLSW